MLSSDQAWVRVCPIKEGDSVNTSFHVTAFVCPSGEGGPYTEQALGKYLQMNKLIRPYFLPTRRTSKLVSFQPALLLDPASLLEPC